MAGIHQALDAHHDRIEAQLAQLVDAARAADWRGYRATFVSLRQALLEHIAFEEHELFPKLAAAIEDDTETDALRGEHERLRRQLETLGAAAPEYDPEGCIGELEELHVFVRQHHERELRLCYPASERLLASDAHFSAKPGFGAKPIPVALDLRGLQPPEPIVRIFAALERSPGEPLRAILPHEPVPLYALLRDRGLRYSGETRPDGGFELLIEKG